MAPEAQTKFGKYTKQRNIDYDIAHIANYWLGIVNIVGFLALSLAPRYAYIN